MYFLDFVFEFTLNLWHIVLECASNLQLIFTFYDAAGSLILIYLFSHLVIYVVMESLKALRNATVGPLRC